MKSKRAKACDISKKVKDRVWERDGGRCIICGSPYAMPNSHYIRRSQGGLGIEENIVTMCLCCHNMYVAKMQAIMDTLRCNGPKDLAGDAVTETVDYLAGANGLPKSNVLQFQSAGSKILVRPSGTEPKVKVYLSSRAATMEEAAAKNEAILKAVTEAYLG